MPTFDIITNIYMGRVVTTRIVILGGTGYLGSRLLRALLSQGNTVTCIHRMTSDIAQFHDIASGLTFCLNNSSAIREVLSAGDVDCVINTSCSYEVPGRSIEDVIRSNLSMPLKLLNLSFDAGVPLFLSVGSGLPSDLNAYTICKSHLNSFGRYFAQRARTINPDRRFQFINIAMVNMYGPNEPASRFIPTVISRLRSNQDILLTEGMQHRDFIYIDDVVRAMIRLLTPLPAWPDYYDVPIGTGQSPTIREIVSYLAEKTESSSVLRFGAVPMRTNEPNCVADVTIMRSMGIEVEYDWKSGFLKLLEETK